jgi:DNA topoisomerase-2
MSKSSSKSSNLKTKNIKSGVDSIKDPTIEEQYEKRSLHEQILDPITADTFIGSIHNDKICTYTYDEQQNIMIKSEKSIVLGLYKIFDEILVNATDRTVVDSKCNKIKVNIDKKTGEISVWNNGSSIPVEMHKKENMYVPELIFGNLLTSSNYNKKGKTTGGKNGFGAKLSNIYSSRFDIEIVDTIRKKKYFQRFTNNMYSKEEPIITNLEKSDPNESYTRITFIPDFPKFNLTGLTDDMTSLLNKRVYDVAGTTNSKVNVWLNDKLIDIKNFKDYINMFYQKDNIPEIIYEEINERWTIAVIYEPNSEFQHMSFVNNICTFKGGKHLDYIVDQIIKKVGDKIKSTPKYKDLKIKPHQIKENLFVFINSVIEDPTFSSQSKEELTVKVSDFGSKCDLDDRIIGKICKTGIINEIVQVAQIKQLGELEKSDGKKNSNLRDITKLDDAKLAGKSPNCTLILTEGDSAKTLAIDGLGVIGNDLFGVFPLKGKLLNVREATPKQLLENEEIINIKKIMGLKQNVVYKNTKSLRYDRLLILTDADHDGSHIKGLVINFIHYFWPDLLKIDGFIQSLATPITKIYKISDTAKLNPEIFYTMNEFKKRYEELKKQCDVLGVDFDKKYIIKYYKGLGTSTSKEAKESFTDFYNKVINYVWKLDDLSEKIIEDNTIGDDTMGDDIIRDEESGSDNISSKSTKSNKSTKSTKSIDTNLIDKNDPSYQALTLAFAKNRADDRKGWVKQRDENNFIENNIKKITFNDFIHKELVHFSHEDTKRSIPDLVDGFKPSQRKIIYGAFKRKLDNQEIKVAQLSGYISEHSGYHHGESSLQGAIIGMAQNYCGSNNINLLYPSGNFGTRRMGGNDAASARYIFTQLSSITRYIFISSDEAVLERVIEDGDIVEPIRYYPVAPMLLVNGCSGIGTGFSSNIPPYNLIDIIENTREFIKTKDLKKLKELKPYYSGFTGRIQKTFDKKIPGKFRYLTYGIYEVIDEFTLKITELPIGVWIQNYKEFLSELCLNGNMLRDFENSVHNHKINFTLYFNNGELQKLIKTDTIEKVLKLTSSISISNMNVYKNNEIVNYSDPNAILADYAHMRLELYVKRKEHYTKVLINELELLKYRRKFIKMVIDKKLIIFKKQKQELVKELEELEFPQLSTDINSKSSFDYLVGMSMWSLTNEKVDELENKYNDKKEELHKYKSITVEELWIKELDELEKVYHVWHEDKLATLMDSSDLIKSKKSKSTKSKSTKSTKSK